MPLVREGNFQLADGSPIKRNVYRLAVEWEGSERHAEILAIGNEPLLGVQMLDGYKLCLDFGNNTLTIVES